MRRAPSSRPSQCRCWADAGQPLLPVYRYTHLYAPQVNPAYLYTGVHTCTHITMLDIQGLPKNANGFRTTHTCELCGFEPKTKNKYREKQALLRHYTGKHGVLELSLREALQARGINYHLSDSAKRKSMGNQNNAEVNKAKIARMSPPLETTIL